MLLFQGALAARNGDFAAATEKFEQALKVEPGFVEAYYSLGSLSLQQDHFASRLGKDGDERIAEAAKKRGDIRQLLQAGETPELELVSQAKAESDGIYSFEVRLRKPGKSQGRLVLRVDGQDLRDFQADPVVATCCHRGGERGQCGSGGV